MKYAVGSDGTQVTDVKQVWSGCKKRGKVSVIFYSITGGGHEWPDSDEDSKVGTASTEVDASRIIRDNVSAYQRWGNIERGFSLLIQ